ncbi:AAA family ATPase [Thaumasiovibrio subtropicus]|uniref:AAA family ATPase n=2 Tax=Thaumasiovibrio subtropicus TaxID=1891207 RepID=UPI001C85852C|nr:AAA family ATPase [Thaumasiovibrio subtropicus]
MGFKNNKNKFDLNWPKELSVKSLKSIIKYDREENWWKEQTRLHILKDTLSLSIKFDDIAVKMKSGELYIIKDNPYIEFNQIKNDINEKEGLFFIKDDESITLSSGQEIFSYMIPSLAAEIEEESLVIIDEPELYLHPTLEIGLINMLKHLLEDTNSSAIIATHSALITREVSEDGVKILRRNEGFTTVHPAEIQTFGESLEVIIGEAFDDYSTHKPFQYEIDGLKKSGKNLQTLISDSSREFGDEALAYINSNEDEDEIEIVRK